jgi:hypothetical protein
MQLLLIDSVILEAGLCVYNMYIVEKHFSNSIAPCEAGSGPLVLV